MSPSTSAVMTEPGATQEMQATGNGSTSLSSGARRAFTSGFRNAPTSDFAKAVKSLQPTIDYAATQNVVVNLENDDPVVSSTTRVLAAIKLANTPYFRALPDFGN